MIIDDLIITELESISAYSLNDSNLLFTLDELQDATIEQSQDSSDVTGRGGRKIATLKKNKAVKISGTSGIVSGGLMQLQTGSEFTKEAKAIVLHTEVLTAHDGAVTFSATPAGSDKIKCTWTSGGNGNGVFGKLVEVDPVTGVTNKTITLGTTDDEKAELEGKEVTVQYFVEVAGAKLINASDKFSQKCKLYVDVLCEDKCSNVYHGQYCIPKADFSGEFSMEFGGDQVTHKFDAEALAGGCKGGNEFYTFTIFGNEDTPVANG